MVTPYTLQTVPSAWRRFATTHGHTLQQHELCVWSASEGLLWLPMDSADFEFALDDPYTRTGTLEGPTHLVLHEPAGPGYKIIEGLGVPDDPTERTLKGKGLGVHFQVGFNPDSGRGQITQHNPITSKLSHAGSLNTGGVGIEVQNPYAGALRPPWQDAFKATWAWKGSYIMPRREQLAALADLIQIFETFSAPVDMVYPPGHPYEGRISIDYGLTNPEAFADGEAPVVALYAHRDTNEVAGIAAHGHSFHWVMRNGKRVKSSHSDGFGPFVYLAHRLLGWGPDDAYAATILVLRDGTGRARPLRRPSFG